MEERSYGISLTTSKLFRKDGFSSISGSINHFL